MDNKKLFDAIDGLMAYDVGATDSGIKDDALKEEVKTYLHESDYAGEYILQFVHERLKPEGGCTIEDVVELLDWLRDELNWTP